MKLIARMPAALLTVTLLLGLMPLMVGAAPQSQIPQGSRWIQEVSPTTLNLASVQMLGKDDGWAVGGSGVMLRYSPAGWQEVTRATTNPLSSISLLNANEGWAVGSDTVLHLAGGQWQMFPHPSPIFPESVSAVSSDNAWILEGQRVMRYANGQWGLPAMLPNAQRMMGLDMLSADSGWAVGFGGIILNWDGKNWNQVQSPTASRLNSVSFVDANNGWVVGGDFIRLQGSRGAVLHYVNGQWTIIDVTGIPILTGVSATADGGAWAVGPDGVALHFSADGSWQKSSIPKGAVSVSMASPDEGWAVGNNGLTLHFTDRVLPTIPQPAPQQADPERLYFQQTGHYLSTGFLHYWQQHGGLAIFGYPVTEEFTELNPPPPAGDGKPYTVQYFERARFEYHPEFKGTPFETELGLLGHDVTAGRLDQAFIPEFGPNNPVPSADPDHRYFAPQSYFALSYGFKYYWEHNGGLAVFGLPISREFTEVNPEDGQEYTVQYFERARFEYHPEFKGTLFEVELGLLGKQVLRDRNWIE